MRIKPGHLLVSGRWDNNVAVVDVEAALRPENDGTDKAVISRPRVTPDVDTDGDGKADAPASGQPVSIVVDKQGRYGYVGNHSGAATPAGAGAYQHGHPGLITILDLAKAKDPAHDGTLGAVAAFMPTGRTGPVGCALAPDGASLLVNCGEAAESEDGGDELTILDLATRRARARVKLKENAAHPAQGPSKHDSPHPSFGRYPNRPVSPFRRCAAEFVSWPMADFPTFRSTICAPRWRASPTRKSGASGWRPGPSGWRSVRMASSSPSRRARAWKHRSKAGRSRSSTSRAPPRAARTPNSRGCRSVATIPPSGRGRSRSRSRPTGKQVVASCFRSNTISFVDVAAAIAGRPAEIHRLHPTAPGGVAARPRGIAMAGGRYAAVIGGAKNGPRSSLVWLIDLASARVVATVTQVGNESYGLDAIPAEG